MLNKEMIAAMKENLKMGVTVQVAPQLFQTPPELGNRMAQMLNITESDKILEPEAGTGSLIKACGENWKAQGKMVAIEINSQLCESLKLSHPQTMVICADFLSITPEILGNFNKIVMNPPFTEQQDVDHILHAFSFLEKGGVLVSIVSEGPFFRQNEKSRNFIEFLHSHGAEIIPLSDGSFKDSGTMVKTRLIRIHNE